MEQIRKPFQGVWNIIRFNWQYYLFSLVFISGSVFFTKFWIDPLFGLGVLVALLALALTLISLLASFYTYDLSGFYSLEWIDRLTNDRVGKIVNINAGFDETSQLLKMKFPNSELAVFDFYEPDKHTEVSIKRARKMYPPFPGTKQILTSSVPLPNEYVDKIFIILSAHEIRDEAERIDFLKELKRILKFGGQIVVIEHLRDVYNFLAYNIGYFHFYSKKTWHRAFQHAGLNIVLEKQITTLITAYVLE